jgi:hypothetical protein
LTDTLTKVENCIGSEVSGARQSDAIDSKTETFVEILCQKPPRQREDRACSQVASDAESGPHKSAENVRLPDIQCRHASHPQYPSLAVTIIENFDSEIDQS